MTLPSDAPRARLRSVLALLAGAPGEGAIAAQALIETARRHRLSPLLSTVAMDELAVATVCRRDRAITAARNLLFVQAAERCLRAFDAAKVPVIVLKGLAYEAAMYPPGTRPTSDVDLLVPHATRRSAFAVMDQLGFEPRAAAPGFDDADYHEVAWHRDGIEVDLHLALAPFARCDIDYRAVWDEAIEFTLGAGKAKTLNRAHAAVFHALHMAIDHFDVPALYLVDFDKLLADRDQLLRAEETARAWRCWRPFATALALCAEFLPSSAAAKMTRDVPPFARAVVASYGGPRVARPEQLVRKFRHFDSGRDGLRYLLVQGRRNVRELYEGHIRKRSARERLALDG